MPSVVINDLYLNLIAGTITAGTNGRGLWRSDLKSNCLNSVIFPSNVVQGGEIHLSYNNSITSQASIDVNPRANIHY